MEQAVIQDMDMEDVTAETLADSMAVVIVDMVTATAVVIAAAMDIPGAISAGLVTVGTMVVTGVSYFF